jgi:hypothetical protein
MSWRAFLNAAMMGGQLQPLERPARQWSPFSAIKTGMGPTWQGSTGFDTTTPTKYDPQERGQVGFPISGTGYQALPASTTQGDFVGSWGGAVNDAQGHVNIGNFIPYLTERNKVMADQINKQFLGGSGNLIGDLGKGNLSGVLGDALKSPVDWLMGGVQVVSDVAGPILSAIPNYIISSAVSGRAKGYRAAAQADRDIQRQGYWVDAAGAHRTDPQVPGDGGYTPWKILPWQSAFDLPQNAKDAINANPDISDEDLGKLLDQAGRQITYDPSMIGFTENLVGTGMLYAPELVVGGAAIGGLKGSATIARAVTAAERIPGVAKGFSVAAKAVPLYAKVQRAALVAGTSEFVLTTSLEAKARFEGDQAALDYWEKLNSTTPISNDPNVQLVTAFMVNPFSPAVKAIKGVKMPEGVPVFGGRTVGILPLTKGLGHAVLYAPGLADRLHTLWTDADAVNGVLGKAYGRTVPQMREWVGPGKFYENNGEAAAELLDVACDEVDQHIPLQEREIFQKTHLDPRERTEAFLNTYSRQIVKALDDPKALAARLRAHAAYANLRGPFNPELLATLRKDYRTAKVKSEEIRARMDAVIGYPDTLAPEAAAIMRSEMDAIPGDTVTMAQLNDWKVSYSAMRRLDAGLIEPGMTAVPKAAVTQMIERGELLYSDALRKNPYGVKYGKNPTLTQGSQRADIAEAVGATPKQLEDLMGQPGKNTDYDGLRQYVIERTGLTAEDVAGLSNDEVWAKATKAYEDIHTAAIARGKEQVTGRAQAAKLQKQIAEAEVSGDKTAAVEYRKQLGNLQEILDSAEGPITTYSEDLAGIKAVKKRDTAAAVQYDRAMRKVDAQYRLQELNALADECRGLTEGEMGTKANPLELLDMVRDGRWAGDTPPMPTRLKIVVRRYVSSLETTQAAEYAFKGARVLVEDAGDRTLWEMAQKFYRSGNPNFMRMLNDEKYLVAADGYLRPGGSVKLGWDADSVAAMMASHKYGTSGEAPRLSAEQAIEELGRMRDARDAILGSQTYRAVVKEAGLKVSPEWVQTAEGELSNGTAYDPGFVAYTHPANVAKLQALSDSLDPISIDAVREIMAEDPVLYGRAGDATHPDSGLAGLAHKRSLEIGETVTPDEYLQQLIDGATPEQHPLQRLIPPGFPTPRPGIIEPTSALDEALLAGDNVDAASGLASIPGPVDPLHGVPLADAMAVVRGKKYTREITKKLRASNADMNSIVDPVKLYGAKPVAAIPTEGVAPARFLTDARNNARLPSQFKSEDGYVYRVMSDDATGAAWDEGTYVSTGAPDTIYVTATAQSRIVRARDPGNLTEAGGGVNAAKNRRVAGTIPASAQEFLGADGAWHPVQEPVIPEPTPVVGRNRLGADVLSVILRGRTGHPPVTLAHVVRALQEIESGRASGIGMGDALLAEGQRVGREILDSAVGHVQVGEFPPGLFMQGLNPLHFDDLGDFVRDLGLTTDDQFVLQYGLKRRPKGAIVRALEANPDLAQEFLLGHYRGYEERIGLARVADAIGAFFSPTANMTIIAANRARFNEAVIARGGTAELGDTIWDHWRTKSQESHNILIRKNAEGFRSAEYGNDAFYADIRNLPGSELEAGALGRPANPGRPGSIGAVQEYYDSIKSVVPDSLKQTNFADLFRESSSFTRRTLKGLPMGEGLAQLYGSIAHSSWVTTGYYWLRFKLDPRMNWMNAFEPMFLYAGRAGLKSGETAGMFGVTKEAFTHLADDGMANTGYPISAARGTWAYRNFLKEQRPELLDLMRSVRKEDGPLIEKAMTEWYDQLAHTDPELVATIKGLGDTPEGYLAALKDWHSKIMSAADPEAMVDMAIQDAAVRTPAMAELYGRVAERNHELIESMRELYFGNPNRTQFERVMNSYLLFWPISYQLKAAKWWTKVLFDSVGGLPTNAGGAYVLNQIAALHQKMLLEDPEYAKQIEANKTLLFVTQMMFPLDPLHPLSWSLSPILRDAFFGRTKQIADIGPIYTFTNLAPAVTTEIYRNTSDLPGWGAIYPMVTGYKKPKDRPKPTEPLDTSRWNQ